MTSVSRLKSKCGIIMNVRDFSGKYNYKCCAPSLYSHTYTHIISCCKCVLCARVCVRARAHEYVSEQTNYVI